MFIAEVGEGVDLVEDSTALLGLGERTLAGDGDEIVALGSADGLFVRALPSAVVDLVGECEALVVLSERTGLTY
jgi:hypothetical protein